MRFAFCGHLAMEGSGGFFLRARSAAEFLVLIVCAHLMLENHGMLRIYHLQGPDCVLGGQSFLIVTSIVITPHSVMPADGVSVSLLTTYLAAQ